MIVLAIAVLIIDLIVRVANGTDARIVNAVVDVFDGRCCGEFVVVLKQVLALSLRML